MLQVVQAMHAAESCSAEPARHIPEKIGLGAGSLVADEPTRAPGSAGRVEAPFAGAVALHREPVTSARAEAEASLAGVMSVVLGVGGASLLLHGMTAPGSACTMLGLSALLAVAVVQVRAVLLLRRLGAAGEAGGASLSGGAEVAE